MKVAEMSVILPLFGDHRAGRSLPAVCRAWLQQEVPCEVVVAVAAGTAVPPLGDDVDPDRVRIVPAGSAPVAPGPLRNLAAAASRASLLYLGDADIVPLGRDYVERAMAFRGQVLIQPWMYRLVNPDDLGDGPAPQPPGRGQVCHVAVDRDGCLAPVGRERFTWLNPEIMVVEPPAGFGWRNEDGTPWRAFPFHWGGILVDRATFDAVGGYCTRYVGWGCEDDDLIAKLEGRASVVRAWRVARRLTCLHFEHPRTHTAASIRTNQTMLAQRLASGVDAMVEEDRRIASRGAAPFAGRVS
jgi:hypothetical protein